MLWVVGEMGSLKENPCTFAEEHPGDHNHQDFPKSIAGKRNSRIIAGSPRKFDGGQFLLIFPGKLYGPGGGAKKLEKCPPARTGTKISFPSLAIQMRGVLGYKWEAYCDTNGGSTEVFPFPELSGTESTAIQIGGVLQYK